MRRHQFSLKTMLWLMVVIAAFLAGRATQMRQHQRRILQLEDKLSIAERYQRSKDERWAAQAKASADELARVRAELGAWHQPSSATQE